MSIIQDVLGYALSAALLASTEGADLGPPAPPPIPEGYTIRQVAWETDARLPALTFGALAAGDWLSTQRAISRGGRELHPSPLMRTSGGRLAGNALTAYGLTKLDLRFQARGQRKRLWAFRILTWSAYSAVVAHNLTRETPR